jgi:hypothetical protein
VTEDLRDPRPRQHPSEPEHVAGAARGVIGLRAVVVHPDRPETVVPKMTPPAL